MWGAKIRQRRGKFFEALRQGISFSKLPWPIVDDLPIGSMTVAEKMEHIPKFVYLSEHLVGLIMSSISKGDRPFLPSQISAWWPADFLPEPRFSIRKEGRSPRGRAWMGQPNKSASLLGNPSWRGMDRTETAWKRPATDESGHPSKRLRSPEEDGPSQVALSSGLDSSHLDLEHWFRQGWSKIW